MAIQGFKNKNIDGPKMANGNMQHRRKLKNDYLKNELKLHVLLLLVPDVTALLLWVLRDFLHFWAL